LQGRLFEQFLAGPHHRELPARSPGWKDVQVVTRKSFLERSLLVRGAKG